MPYPILRSSTTDKPAQAGWPVYGAYTIKPKRQRRTKGAIASIRDTIKDILEESHPQTCRQIFYAATVKGAVAKVETEYQKTIISCAPSFATVSSATSIKNNSRYCGSPSSRNGNC